MSSLQTLIDAVSERIALQGERIRAEIASGLTETRNGLRVKAAAPRPVDGMANRPLNSGPCRLVGWSLRVTGGTAAITLSDSRDGSGDALAVPSLTTDGATVTHWFGPGGVSVGEALFFGVTGTGTVTGSVYLGAVD